MLIIALAAALSPYCTPEPHDRKFTVLVDAGHGGRDPGAPAVIGQRFEKEVNLAIALLVAAKVTRSGNVSVIMTRTNDRYLSLISRRQSISRCRPDLVVSIHADSGPQGARGSSVYVLDSKGEAIVINRMWKKSRTKNPDDVDYIIADLTQRGAINWSSYLAASMQSELNPGRKTSGRPKLANLALLKAPGIPSILVETGYVSDPADCEVLFSRAGQNAIAEAISRNIINAVASDKGKD